MGLLGGYPNKQGGRDSYRESRTGKWLLSALAIAMLFWTSGAAKATDVSPADRGNQRAFLNAYCVGCHQGQHAAAGIALDHLDVAHPASNARTWERVLVQLNAGMMPPQGTARPADARRRAFIHTLEQGIDHEAASHPNPGRTLLHRLNRTEYANSVRDLLDLQVDVTGLLPADDMSHGFDNMAEVLKVSPTLLAGYVRAAGKISRLALGEAHATPTEEIYHLPSTLSQTGHIEGTPLGTRGGIAISHHFPADGEYVFRTTLYFTTNTFLFGMYAKDEQVEVAINGERVALFPVNPMMKGDEALKTPPIKVKAGPQVVTVAFVQKAAGPVEDLLQPFGHSLGDLFLGRTQGLTGLPHVRDVAINGPYHVTGVGPTPSRNRIFVRRPESPSDELPCAREILSRLATRAYRGAVADEDLQNLVTAYRLGRQQGDFEEGVRTGLQYILANPRFIFRFERVPSKSIQSSSIQSSSIQSSSIQSSSIQANQIRSNSIQSSNYRLTDLELASRLSYFLWSSGPDERTLRLARTGKLSDPNVLETEVRRMLADPRSLALATNFAGQWLHLRNLKDVQPDLFAFPNFNHNLLDSMRRETELFFDNLVHEDRSVMELLTADYTFVDEQLARHYGIPDVEGNRFRRVRLADPNRRGLLGQGSILTVTSFANRTSPVVRGKWIMDTLLGAPPPQPPANIPPLVEASEGVKTRTVRERLEEHRRNPACASCHTKMDPIGFALENFDATGVWRIHDAGSDLDATGQMVDGSSLNGPTSLRNALVRRSDAFLNTFTQKLLTYALGRGTEYFDMPAVRAIVRHARGNDNRFSAYVLGIVQSVPFQMSRAEHLPTDRSTGGTGKAIISSDARKGAPGTISGRRRSVHVYHQKTSLTARRVARYGRLTGVAVARLDGGGADSPA